MAESTQNLDSGMNNPSPDPVGMGIYVVDGKVYQPEFILIPQFDGDGIEIAPARVGDLNVSGALLPTYDQGNETYFQSISNTLVEMSTSVASMPYGRNRGWPGQATLSDTTETDLVAFPYGGPYALDMKAIHIDNDSDDAVRVWLRPEAASSTMWSFRCPSKETRLYNFSGVGPQGFGDTISWTVQLDASPTGGNVIVSGFGVDVRTE